MKNRRLENYWERPDTTNIDNRVNKLQDTLSKTKNPKQRAQIQAKLDQSLARQTELRNAQPVMQSTSLGKVNIDNPNQIAQTVQNQYEETAQNNFLGQNPDQYTDFGQSTVKIGPDGKPVITTQSTGQNRQILDEEYRRDRGINDLANDLMQDFRGRKNVDPREGLQKNFDLESARKNLTPLQGISRQNLPELTSDFSADRNRIEDELYSRRERRLNKSFKQQDQDMAQSLADRGINPGTPLYDRIMGDYRQSQNDAYSDAMGESIRMGGEEQARMNQMRGSNRAQLFGENQAESNQIAQNRSQEFSEFQDIANTNLAQRNQGFQENQAYQNTPLQQVGQLYQNYKGYRDPQFQAGFSGLNQQVFDPSGIYANQQNVNLQREALRRRGAGSPQAPYYTAT